MDDITKILLLATALTNLITAIVNLVKGMKKENDKGGE